MNARIVDVAVNPTSVPPDLSICPSNIKGAGNGLFSNKFLSSGSVICEYKGGFLTEDDERLYGDYVLSIGDPPMTTLNGHHIIAIDADPNINQEIGYGGFANDLHTDYKDEIRQEEKKDSQSPFSEDFRIKIVQNFQKNPNHKWTKKERRKAKKGFLAFSKSTIKDAYIKYGYNSAYCRLNGAASFVLMSLKEIYPGEEIYVPYGSKYWDSRKNNE